MTQKETERPRSVNLAQPGRAEARRSDVSSPKFFLAVCRSTLGASRIYRVYPEPQDLSFLGLGPPHPTPPHPTPPLD
jgi:hypothetical protein